MGWYDTKPWLASYGDEAIPEVTPTTLLDTFRRTVAAVPDTTAIAYFDARLSYRCPRRAAPAVTGLPWCCRTSRSSC